MALSRITKVGGNSLEDPLNFTGGLNITGIATATGGIDAIGIQSGGVTIASGIITALNFVGTGNTFTVRGNTVDISISGGGGGASQVYDSTVFAYQNVIQSNITVSSPYKTATIYTDPNTTVDIDSGYQISVDSGCVLNIIDI